MEHRLIRNPCDVAPDLVRCEKRGGGVAKRTAGKATEFENLIALAQLGAPAHLLNRVHDARRDPSSGCRSL